MDADGWWLGLKILQVHNRYRSSSPSGENRVVDNEAAALSQRGHTLQHFERFSEEIDTWTAPKKALLPGRVVWSASSYNSLVHYLRQNRPDLVHIHNLFPLLSPSVLHACSRERVPLVATLHNYRPMCPTGELFRQGAICHECAGRTPVAAVRHRCYRSSSLATLPLALSSALNQRTWQAKVSAFICISESQRRILSPLGLPAHRTFVKPNLVPSAPSAPRSQKQNIVVFTGRLAEAKGVHTLIKAWDLYSAASSGDTLRLVIAGAGPLSDDVSAWAKGRPDIDFLGMLRPDDCGALLQTARATVVPSDWEETFGLVVIEAMAAGVAVIASAHGSFPELLIDGEEGTLFPPGDAAALAKAFHDLETAPDRYERYGYNARTAYETRFDPHTNLDRLLAIYEFAIEHPVWDATGATGLYQRLAT